MPEDRQSVDDDFNPSADQASDGQQSGSGLTGKKFKVPEDMVNAGSDINDVNNDSPETLDEDLS